MIRSPACRGSLVVVLMLFFLAVGASGQETTSEEPMPRETASEEPTSPAAAEAGKPGPAGEKAAEKPDAAASRESKQPLFGKKGPDKDPLRDVPDMRAALTKMIVVVLVLCGLLVGGLMAFKRFGRRGTRLSGTARPLRIVDKLAVGPKQWICLLNACGQYLLVGVAEKEISVLMEMTLPEDEEGNPKDFAGALKDLNPPLASHDRQTG